MEIDNNGILIGKKSTTIGAEFNKTRGKSALLRSLVNDPLHQINWETPYYNKFIEECLNGEELSGKVCLDLGCGDGRFTEYLINMGVKKVICVDADYEPLHKLSIHSEKKGYRDKIELIYSGVENIPIKNEGRYGDSFPDENLGLSRNNYMAAQKQDEESINKFLNNLFVD